MTASLYDKGRQAFLEGNIHYLTDNIQAVLCSSGYTPDLANHQYLSDIPTGNRVATTANLTGKTSTAGVAFASDSVFAAVPASQPVGTQVVYFQATGTDTTARLIGVDNTLTGLPVTPNGGDINLSFSKTAGQGIFKL